MHIIEKKEDADSSKHDMKPIYFVFIAIGAVILVGIIIVYFSMQKPLYAYGNASDESKLRYPLNPPDQDGEDGIWKVEHDIDLFHFASGEGSPILFIHGYALSPPTEPIEGLNGLSGYSVHYYHQRGCGFSTRPIDTFASQSFYKNMTELDRTLGAAANLADIERIRRILKQDKLTLVGHSYGGFLATLYASEFPSNVEKLILIAPANVLRMPQRGKGLYDAVLEYLPVEREDDYNQWVKEHFDYGNIFTKSELQLAKHNSKMSEYYALAAEKAGMPFPTEEESSAGIAGGWLIHAYNFSFGKKYDLRPQLANISAPVLIFQGQRDLTGQAEIQDYIDAIPDSEVIFNNSGHFLMEEPEFTREVQVFLDS